MPSLQQSFDPHHNALGALRLGAALLVVLGHAYEVGGFGPDPLHRAAGLTLGEFGVNVFFSISGFLVARSWENSSGPGPYLAKRALRIFPGLWLCLFLTGFLIFPWLAARQPAGPDAAGLSESFLYFWHNAWLKVRQTGFAGLFSDHPAAGVANGSLWSLFPEALCYLGLPVLAWLGGLRGGRRWLPLAIAFLLTLAQAAAPRLLPGLASAGPLWWLWRLSTQAAFFVGGVCLHIHSSRIPASPHTAIAATLLLVAAPPLGLYPWIGPLVLPAALLLAASRLPARNLDKGGDYSYGLYLYHYPVQQSLIALGASSAGAAMFFAHSLLVSLPLAAFSWWCVEKPALKWKPAPRRRTSAA